MSNRKPEKSPTTQRAVAWFRDNLEFLLEDIRFGDRVDLCFDTEDFRGVALGMYQYLDLRTERFWWQSYKNLDETVLVHALASAGWLGRLELLPPHRAEFLGLLKRDFGLSNVSRSPLELAGLFLRQGFREIAPGLRMGGTLDELTVLEGEELIESFGQRAELAKELFKLLQLVRGSWRTRLMEWDRYLRLTDVAVFDPSPHFRNGVFVRVRDRLDEARGPTRSMNTISDALAVAVLAERLRAFDSGSGGGRLPVFFLHAGDLRDAISEAGVEEELRFKGSRRRHSILRDWRYFLMRATLGPRGQMPRSARELEGLARQAELIHGGREKVSSEAAGILEVAGSKLDILVRQLEEFEFFGNVWLSSWKDDLVKVLAHLERAQLLEQQLKASVEELQSDEIRESFEKARATIEEKFRLGADLYHGVSDLFRAIDQRVGAVCRELAVRGHDQDEIVIVLGSFRFPFSAEAHQEIRTSLMDLASKESRLRLAAQTQIISALSEARTDKWLPDPTLSVLLGVLWATELDWEILVLGKLQGVFGFEYRLARTDRGFLWLVLSVVWIAALVRHLFGEKEKRYGSEEDGGEARDLSRGVDEEDVKEALERLKRIERNHGEYSSSVKGRLAISIAYIKFHLFTSLCPRRSSRWPESLPRESPEELLRSAIEYAESARHAQELEEKLKVYAVNQVVYYLAEGIRHGVLRFSDQEMRLENAGRQLAKNEGVGGWHYRYDDSLARYYGILGRERKSKVYWELGRRHMKSARLSCFGDPLIINYAEEYEREYRRWKEQEEADLR